MKKFTVPCYFNGAKSPFTIYIGSPEDAHHPLHFQADWLQKERGGVIPQEVMDSIAKLKDLADKNGVSFEELCVYALGTAQQGEGEGEGGEGGEGGDGGENVDNNDNTDTPTPEDEPVLEEEATPAA